MLTQEETWLGTSDLTRPLNQTWPEQCRGDSVGGAGKVPVLGKELRGEWWRGEAEPDPTKEAARSQNRSRGWELGFTPAVKGKH